MRLPHVRLTMSQMMILVALAALNLAGIRSTAKAWPQIRYISRERIDSIHMSDGSILAIDPLGSGSRPTHLKGPSLSGLLRVWGPIALSSGISLLVVTTTFVRGRRARKTIGRACKT
jgi:hypothetical protein